MDAVRLQYKASVSLKTVGKAPLTTAKIGHGANNEKQRPGTW